MIVEHKYRIKRRRQFDCASSVHRDHVEQISIWREEGISRKLWKMTSEGQILGCRRMTRN